ncbi:MAG TPA: HDOD domain-containing protein [Pyrinomonadaceae bacterium]|nr:HDOD domain-containing protein [Pyrinomonadaceae bacterium]
MLNFDKEYFTIPVLVKTGLPPLPGSVMRISAMLADLNTSQREIAEAISLDPILSSRMLRLANSAIYGLREQVTNLETAVFAIGTSSIAQTITMSGISDAFGRRVLSSPAGQEVWGHSLATAMAATEICRIKGFRGADEAFTCGLLHDIGKLILLRADTPLYLGILELAALQGPLTDVESEAFGFDHTELGAAAAQAWGLPSVVCDVIRHHHQPWSPTEGLRTTQVLHAADTLVNLKTADGETEKIFEDDTVLTFGLNAEQLDEIWKTVLVRLAEVLATLS